MPADDFQGLPPGYAPPSSSGFAASSAGSPGWLSGNRLYKPKGFNEVTLDGNAPAAIQGFASSGQIAQQTVAGPAGTDEPDKNGGNESESKTLWWIVGVGGVLTVGAITAAVVASGRRRKRRRR